MQTFVIIDISYKKSLEEVNPLLEAHRSFLDHYYSEGVFIVSGAKDPRTGGIIVAKGSKENIQMIIKEDPFFIAGVAEYTLTAFHPTKYHEDFESIFQI